MATIKLKNDDLFIIITHDKKDYFQFHGLPISTEFKHNPSGALFIETPDTFQCEGDVNIEVNHDAYLVDMVFGGSMPQFVGPRPKNIVKR